MAKNVRTVPGEVVQDQSIIDNLTYNDAAGSQKVSEVGRHLLPVPFINAGALAYTTDLSTTARPLPKSGMGLAVYNKDTTLHAVTLGDDGTVTALAAGATDSSGNVGVPCAPGAWTYVATSLRKWVKTDSAQLVVLLISDNSLVVNQSPAQVPNY